MARPSSSLLHCIRTMVGAYRDDSRSDAELISRYAATHDEAAFTVLAVRHGPMIWSICSGILGPVDAEDACQVVLLTLARKAGAIHVKETLAGWLHQVARRAAFNTRKAIKSRQKFHKQLQAMARSEETVASEQGEDYEVLHEELAKLPEKLRVPLILCYMEGKTEVEAARILGVTESAMWKRMARGKSLLQTRLSKRGMNIGTTTLGALLAGTASRAAMPAGLIHKTVRGALTWRDETLTGGMAELAKPFTRLNCWKYLYHLAL